MNTEATDITVKRPGFKIELDETEMRRLWAELETLINLKEAQLWPLTSRIIDALRKEIA